jgi:hypothetical protein
MTGTRVGYLTGTGHSLMRPSAGSNYERRERTSSTSSYWCFWIAHRSIGSIAGASPETFLPKGTEAEDTVTAVSYDDLEDIHSTSDAEIVLKFSDVKPDLYAIIVICAAIHLDPETTNYTLQHYNCYFLARTIIALISRYCLLQACSASKGLRWDCITKSAISCHIFGEDWNKLRTAIRMAMATRIEKLILDTFKKAAGTLPAKRKE